ncbi:MAG: hypothetical protein ABWX96_20585 [Propionibacteriaceae bacterium]
MRVEIRAGGDGVACWNHQAIATYADEVNEREAHLTQRNPDLVVLPGRISCYGCEAQEYGYGIKCTAQISKTMFAVPGEIQPRPADAEGWHREIPGLATIRPEDADSSQTVPPPSPQTSIDPDVPVATGRSGLRGLFHRS